MLNTLYIMPHFILTQILGIIIWSILQITWLVQLRCRRAEIQTQTFWLQSLCSQPLLTWPSNYRAHVTAQWTSESSYLDALPPSQNKQAFEKNDHFPSEDISSSNVLKLSQWTFYFLWYKMPSISPFTFPSFLPFIIIVTRISAMQHFWVQHTPLIHSVKSNRLVLFTYH